MNLGLKLLNVLFFRVERDHSTLNTSCPSDLMSKEIDTCKTGFMQFEKKLLNTITPVKLQ